MMEPLHFGPAARRLFGVRHLASGTPRQTAILICPPWGMEYVQSYRALRQLANLLAQNGYETLRFDYSCTGDSAGDEQQARLQDWIQDIVTAARELKELSGALRVCVIGVRLGALLALAAATDLRVQDWVLWDAPIDGDHYVRERMDFQRRVDEERNRVRTSSARLPPCAPDELLGHAWPEAVADAVRALKPEAFPGARTLLIATPGVESLRLESAQRELLADTASWSDVLRIAAPWNPSASLNHVVGLLKERLP